MRNGGRKAAYPTRFRFFPYISCIMTASRNQRRSRAKLQRLRLGIGIRCRILVPQGMAAMWASFDLFRGANGFLEAFEFLKHLLQAFFVSFLLGGRKLLDDFFVKFFNFRFEDGHEIFHKITLRSDLEIGRRRRLWSVLWIPTSSAF